MPSPWLSLATAKLSSTTRSRHGKEVSRHGWRLLTRPSMSMTSMATTGRRMWRLFSTQPIDNSDEEGQSSTSAAAAETFLTGTSSLYAEQMFEQYQMDPNSVHPSWKQYFDNMLAGVAYHESDYSKPTSAVSTSPKKRTAVAVVSVRNVRKSNAEGRGSLIASIILCVHLHGPNFRITSHPIPWPFLISFGPIKSMDTWQHN